jgi:hypothetical protein
MAEEDVALFPAWREGLRRFMSAGFNAGDSIEHQWFYDAFGIDMPTPETPCKDAEKAKLQWLGAFETLREHLLTEHQIALASVRGYGYRVVPPGDQTKWAEGEGMDDIKSAARKMGMRLTNVNLSVLDADRRRENADALARLSMLSGMVKRLGSA